MARLLVTLVYLWLGWLLVVAGCCALLAIGGGHFSALGVGEALFQLFRITTVFFATSLPFYLPVHIYMTWRSRKDDAAREAANVTGTPCHRCKGPEKLHFIRYGVSEGYLLFLARESMIEGLFCTRCVEEIVEAGVQSSRAGLLRSLRGPLCYLITAHNALYVLGGLNAEGSNP